MKIVTLLSVVRTTTVTVPKIGHGVTVLKTVTVDNTEGIIQTCNYIENCKVYECNSGVTVLKIEIWCN